MIEHPPWRFAFRCWIALGLAALSTAASAQDPWPERQRTPNRTARADWVGPQVPVVVWKTRVDPEEFETQYRANPLLDAEGRLFVVTWRHVTALDSAGGAILWQFAAPDWVPWSPSLWRGHLLFGCVDQNFYCLDSATGTELWRVPDESFPGGQVVDSAGVVYYRSGHQNIGRRFYARRVVDGSLVWAIDTPVTEREAPSLSEDESTFFIGRPEWAQWVSRRTSDGSFVWAFQMQRDTYGSSPVENGRVYVGSPDRHDYCIDASTGQLVWRFSGEFITSNTLALADDGTVYTFHGFGRTKTFFALNPDGTEKWRIYLDSDYWVDQPPIVAGDGTIYVATRASVLRLGRVYAINPDGTILWQYDFPHYTSASPTLGPDGTLYVLCRDRNVYAFRDWERAAPTGLTVLRGLTLSGGLADLTESDDSRLVVRPWFVLTTQEAPVQVVVESTSPIPNPRKILFTLEASASIPNINQKIELFNYVTGTWETVDTRPATTADSIAEIVITINPERFIQPVTLAMKAKISYKEAGPILLYPWQARLDHVFWTVYHSP